MADQEHQDHMGEVRRRVMDIQERLDVRNLSDHDMLIRLNTLVEGVAGSVGEIKEAHVNQTAQLDARVRALESARWMMLGAASAFGAVASVVVQFIKRGP